MNTGVVVWFVAWAVVMCTVLAYFVPLCDRESDRGANRHRPGQPAERRPG